MGERTCSVEGCERLLYGRGWCLMHYTRWRRHGDPEAAKRSTKDKPRSCVVDGCEKPHEAGGWCQMHYLRWRKHASTKLPTRSTTYERFMDKVDTSGGPDSCHPWTAAQSNGYGRFYGDGEYFKATRWLLGYLRGKALGPDELALHHCDNPPCCNPAHLYIGDYAQNTQDMVSRGRGAMQNRTHCPHGHPYDEQNTRWYQGKRRCRTCQRLFGRQRRPVPPGQQSK